MCSLTGCVQLIPRDCHKSYSLEVQQFLNSSIESRLRKGTPTTHGSTGIGWLLLAASMMMARGVNKKCTSSGALGSWMHPFSLARRLKASLNLDNISKNSSSAGPRALTASNPSPDSWPEEFFPTFFRFCCRIWSSLNAAAECCSLMMNLSMSSKQWFKMETYLSFERDWSLVDPFRWWWVWWMPLPVVAVVVPFEWWWWGWCLSPLLSMDPLPVGDMTVGDVDFVTSLSLAMALKAWTASLTWLLLEVVLGLTWTFPCLLIHLESSSTTCWAECELHWKIWSSPPFDDPSVEDGCDCDTVKIRMLS